jgi:hypothetical protein
MYHLWIDIKKYKCGETAVLGRTLVMYRIQENDKEMNIICLPLRSTKVVNIKLPLWK